MRITFGAVALLVTACTMQNDDADFEELTTGLTQGAHLLEQCLESEEDCTTIQQGVGAIASAWIYVLQQRCLSELGMQVGREEVIRHQACLRSSLGRYEFYQSTAMRDSLNEAIRAMEQEWLATRDQGTVIVEEVQ